MRKPSLYGEPHVEIHGQVLSDGEAMTIRVALETLAERMSKKHALGKDETGEAIRLGYLKSIDSIRVKMFGTPAEQKAEEIAHLKALHPNATGVMAEMIADLEKSQ